MITELEVKQMLRLLPPGATPLALFLVGSNLYGTALPESDRDFKLIYLPSAKSILLQQAEKYSLSDTRCREKNTQEVEGESWTLQKFLTLAVGGQTGAVEMLFAPPENIHVYYRPVWDSMIKMKDEIISGELSSFVGYCVSQASKYGRKGRRYHIFTAAVKYLKEFPDVKLTELTLELLKGSVANSLPKTMTLLDSDIRIVPGNPDLLDIIGHQCPLTAATKYAAQMYSDVEKSYGKRAKEAATQGGSDWKAIGHALRIAREATELFKTGRLTLPRPDREELLLIRKGQLPQEVCENLIDVALGELEIAKNNSALPAAPDIEAVSGFIGAVHREIIFGGVW